MNSTIYYCPECAKSINQPLNILDFNFTGSLDGYQLNKFYKHTLAIPMKGYTSSFVDHSYPTYRNYIVETVTSGSLEVVAKGSKIEHNYVFIEPKKIGELYLDGNFLSDEDAIKVVLPNNPNKIHAYSTGSLGLRKANCKSCGKKIY